MHPWCVLLLHILRIKIHNAEKYDPEGLRLTVNKTKYRRGWNRIRHFCFSYSTIGNTQKNQTTPV
jgi:hypothetical protein